MKLTDKEIAEYIHRCYTAVDGLLFVKVEENITIILKIQSWYNC